MTRTTVDRGLLLMCAVLSGAAFMLGMYAVLRPPVAAADDAGLAALQKEVAALRHSVEVTRTQLSTPSGASAIAEVEQRIMRVEAAARRTASRSVSEDSSNSGEANDAAAGARSGPARDDSPRYIALSAPNSAVSVEQGADGAISVRNRDPALAGTVMIVQGRTAEGREEAIPITVPPP